MPKTTRTFNSYTTDNRNARHLSCEGCRKRKMKCSRSNPCVACVLRGQECIWLDIKPSHGIVQSTLEDNEREIARLRKVIYQLQAIIIEREGEPWFPPAALPPTPPTYFDPPFPYPPPPFYDHERQHDSYMRGGRLLLTQGANGGLGGAAFWTTAPEARPSRPPAKVYSLPPPPGAQQHRYDTNGDYVVSPAVGAGVDVYPLPSPRYPPHPFHSGSLEVATSYGFAAAPHARASTWAGPVSATLPTDLPSFSHALPAGQGDIHLSPPHDLLSFPQRQSFDTFSAIANGDLVVHSRSASTSDVLGTEPAPLSSDMLAHLPKIDTNVSIQLPTTVSALLNFTANPKDDSLVEVAMATEGSGALPSAFAIEGAGQADVRAEEEWKSLVALPELEEAI